MIEADAHELAGANAVLRARLEEAGHRNDRLHETLVWALKDAPYEVRAEVAARLGREAGELLDRADEADGRWFGDFDDPDIGLSLTFTTGQWNVLLRSVRGRRAHLVHSVEAHVLPRLRRDDDDDDGLIEALKVTLDTEAALTAALADNGGRRNRAHAERVAVAAARRREATRARMERDRARAQREREREERRRRDARMAERNGLPKRVIRSK